MKYPASALAICLLLSGCEGGKSAPPANIPTTEIPPQDTTSPAAPPAAQAPAPPEEPQPADTVTGRLTLTKGAQPMVDGRLVSASNQGPGLRRCGCAKIGCEQSCSASGDPDFTCR